GMKGAERIIIGDKGRFVKKAFELKANEKISNKEIAKKLNRVGWPVTHKRLSVIFRNPFYCGLLSHNLLNGELVESKHPQLITKELYLKANDVTNGHAVGYKQQKENESLPLKHFVKCEKCQRPMTGYLVRAKGIFYYKCNTMGCCCNVNAGRMNLEFKEVLGEFAVQQKMLAPMKRIMRETFHELLKDKIGESTILNKGLKELE